MWTKEELINNLTSIESVINIETVVDINNPISLINKLNSICNIIGLSAKCIGEGEAIYCNALAEMTYKITKEKPEIGSNERKIYVNGEIGEYIELYTRADKLNKALTECSNSLRTLISFVKSEINLTQNTN